VVFGKERKMFRKQIAIAAGFIGMLISVAPATAGTWGEYGPADPNVVTCRAGRMDVTAPYIQPSRDVGVVGGWQYTSYISVLKQWDSARRVWVPISASPAYFHRADWVFTDFEVFDYYTAGYGWRTTTLGPSFRIATHGYFTITFQFDWYDNVNGQGTNRVVGERDLLPAEVFDERSYPFERNLGYCLY
jgi:hypothetical protein